MAGQEMDPKYAGTANVAALTAMGRFSSRLRVGSLFDSCVLGYGVGFQVRL
jgi:hypothetical protein